MSLSSTISPHLPFLRRYARALSGSQQSGDAFVAATLEALIDDPSLIGNSEPRVDLYRVFQVIWASAYMEVRQSDESGFAEKARQRLKALTPETRQALLLTTLEAFTAEEAGRIMGVDSDRVNDLAAQAREEIERQTRARILIIEDETLIAFDLSDIVEGLGHKVVATADTAESAVEAANAHRPDLILADIQLADGSSGIDAVNEILSSFSVPVIFITAFPDRLLTGERPEPTFLITKPYLEHVVQAAVSQAMFFETTGETV
jgi:DNA-directed RNA polymerase specialized sigma24 family protein/CheY-like chemotaxis protein